MADLKKIAFIITDCDFGGAEQMLFEICSGLKNDFQLQVWVLKRKGYFARKIEEAGVPVKCYDLGTQMGPGYFLKFLLALLKFRADLKIFQPDVLQGILFQANLAAKITGKFAGTPVVFCSLHTFETGVLKIWIEKLTHGLAQKYLVVSDVLKKYLAEYFSLPEQKIMVIKNGIRLAAAKPDEKSLRTELGLPPSGAVIGAIGRLHREKGMDVLIRSFSHLAGEFPDFKLVIIGDGPEKENLRELVSRNNLSERVIFAGFLPEPEKYLPPFEAFVLPSRIEAMPIVLMQAMAAGKAIVASNVGGVCELIDDSQTGFLVPVEDELLMARAISRILRDPALSKRLGAAAREKAERRFSRAEMIDSYRRLYQSAAEGKI